MKNMVKLLGIIAIVAVIGFSFAACGDGSGTTGGGDGGHTHSYSAAWSKNATQHWYECACGDKKDVANHTGDPCTVCRYSTSGAGETITSAQGIELVRVAGGSFQMGNPDESVGYSDERPVHRVTLSGFYMGKYEVTQGQWQDVMGTLPSSLPSSSYGVGDNYPVYFVNWYDALVFCNKLSIAEGLTPAYSINGKTNPADWGSVPYYNYDDASMVGDETTWKAATIISGSTGYRLPTEAQWEYAAKGGDGSPGNYIYAGSNDPDEVAWYSDNSDYTSHTVGTKAPNGLGLYDMSGNVWEWCWDWYGSYQSEAQTDPMGASSGSLRVGRGGFWFNSAVLVRSAYRYGDNPYGRNGSVGFRLVRP